MRDMLKAASPSISRRDCIKLVGGTALAVGMGGLLGGCSSENGTDQEEPTTQDSTTPVSYTHLDVYKRQT